MINLSLQSKNIVNFYDYFQKYFENFSKEKTYLVAVSTGPDSTFLLHFLLKNNFSKLIVCFVNYNTRKNCQKEEAHIINFCKKHQLILKILSYNQKIFSNFQETARSIRYYYFFKLLKCYRAFGIFLAHQKDDYYENIFMKTKNDGHFLLKKETNFYQWKIFRPLLEIWKKDLLNFLKANKIIFFLDHTNILPIYKRNKIRKETKNLLLPFYQENFFKNLQNNLALNKKIAKEIYENNNFFLLKQFIYQNSKVFLWKKITTNKCKNFLEQLIKSSLPEIYFIIEKNHYLVFKNKKIYFLNWIF